MSEILLNEVQHYNIYYSLKTHEVQWTSLWNRAASNDIFIIN